MGGCLKKPKYMHLYLFGDLFQSQSLSGFQMIYYGQGFTHSDVYEMPIYLRNFYYKQLSDTRKKENDEMKKAQQKSKSKTNPRFKR